MRVSACVCVCGDLSEADVSGRLVYDCDQFDLSVGDVAEHLVLLHCEQLPQVQLATAASAASASARPAHSHLRPAASSSSSSSSSLCAAPSPRC